jgi:uncharacterized protein YlxW (UPF0749 family)
VSDDRPEPTPAPGREPPRFASTALLTDLVTNTLDPGYRAAAERRGPNAARRWYDRPLVALGCLLIGFVAVVGYVRANRGAPEAAKVRSGLVSRVHAAEHGADDLAGRVQRLQRQVAAVQSAALPQSGTAAGRQRRVELAAGQLAATGPGMTVTLREPAPAKASTEPGRGGTVPIDATHILSDRDVRSVVNELWLDGAEAIAVNGIRLTPSSAIRFAGQAVLVDFQPISSPYRITAIGSSDQLSTGFAQSSVASRYQTLVSVDHIGFSFSESDKLTLPAGAPAALRHATPEPTPTKRAGR